MEQIERFVVLPNKLTVPFSPEVPMQVVFLKFNLLTCGQLSDLVSDFRFSNVLN